MRLGRVRNCAFHDRCRKSEATEQLPQCSESIVEAQGPLSFSAGHVREPGPVHSSHIKKGIVPYGTLLDVPVTCEPLTRRAAVRVNARVCKPVDLRLARATAMHPALSHTVSEATGRPPHRPHAFGHHQGRAPHRGGSCLAPTGSQELTGACWLGMVLQIVASMCSVAVPCLITPPTTWPANLYTLISTGSVSDCKKPGFRFARHTGAAC